MSQAYILAWVGLRAELILPIIISLSTNPVTMMREDQKMSSVLTTSGGQDPQKVIVFDHFVQENDHFFLISLKVGGNVGGKTIFVFGGGHLPPHPLLAPPPCKGENHQK